MTGTSTKKSTGKELIQFEIDLAHMQKSIIETKEELETVKNLLSEIQHLMVQMAINQKSFTQRLNMWPYIEIDA